MALRRLLLIPTLDKTDHGAAHAAMAVVAYRAPARPGSRRMAVIEDTPRANFSGPGASSPPGHQFPSTTAIRSHRVRPCNLDLLGLRGKSALPVKL